MRPTLIKTSKGLININNVSVIEKVNDYNPNKDSVIYSIRFGLLPRTSAIYETYNTEEDRDAAYDELIYIFG